MVKKKTARQKSREKEAKKLETKDDGAAPKSQKREENAAPAVGVNSGGRLKRKIAKQLQFLSKLQETRCVLGANKVISKKKRIRKKSALNDLSSLAECLPSLYDKGSGWNVELQPKFRKARAHQQLVVNETEQLAKVLAHPEFKSNPFSAIQQHLANALGSLMNDPVRSLDKDKSGKKRKKKIAKVKMGLPDMDRK